MKLTDLALELRFTFSGNRARVGLTLLGLMIGSGSIVMLAGTLKGARDALVEMNQGIHDADTLRLRRVDAPPTERGRPARELSRSDAALLAESEAFAAVDVSTESVRDVQGSYQTNKRRIRLVGAEPTAFSRYDLTLAAGRFLDEDDFSEGRRVVVLGHEIAKDLFDGALAVGHTVTIDRQRYTVIGVLAQKPTMSKGDGLWLWDRKSLIPRTTYDAIYEPTHRVMSIFLRAKDPKLTSTAELERLGALAHALLLDRHSGVKNFEVADREGEAQEQLILTIIQVLLFGTGLVSLFVGGINIMNIMLITVTERTKEIGIRRALGATPKDILLQFLLEAGLIAAVGGALGVLGGIAFTFLTALGLSALTGGWPFIVVPWSLAAGVGLAVTTGVVFGLVPAIRASRLDPVAAFRFE